MRYEKTRKALLFWCLFIGLGAVAGSIGMLSDPTGKAMGMDKMLPYFQVLPFSKVLFQNFIFSGISLFIVNGLSNLIASFFLLKKKKIGFILGGIFGITLMLWIMIQFYIFPMNFMSTIYFIFGLIQAITGYMCYVFYNQEKFKVDEKRYKHLNTNKKELVVYFSRLGYTKKIALELADKSGACVEELIAKEKTSGTLGFWWCGRFGMEHLPMTIEKLKNDPTKFESVTIITPIWVFGMSAPIRTFCNTYKNKLNKVNYVYVHFMKASFKNVANEMDNILGVKRTNFKTICSRIGHVKEVKEVK